MLRKHVLRKVLASRLNVDASSLESLKLRRRHLIQLIQWTEEARARGIDAD